MGLNSQATRFGGISRNQNASRRNVSTAEAIGRSVVRVSASSLLIRTPTCVRKHNAGVTSFGRDTFLERLLLLLCENVMRCIGSIIQEKYSSASPKDSSSSRLPLCRVQAKRVSRIRPQLQRIRVFGLGVELSSMFTLCSEGIASLDLKLSPFAARDQRELEGKKSSREESPTTQIVGVARYENGS